ncbi:MAG: hypothetical protein R3B45_16695 [Bdellovibrionota bacterium]
MKAYFILRKSLAVSKIPLDEKNSIPLQYHAINATLKKRKTSPYLVQPILSEFLKGLVETTHSSVIKTQVTEEQLVQIFFKSIFMVEAAHDFDLLRNEFNTALLELLPQLAQKNAVDLQNIVDLSFLEEIGINFEKISIDILSLDKLN